MTSLLWIAISFVCGALPLAYWVGRVFLHTDIRQYGDGNPGGTNVWRAGGKWWGLFAILLDGFKGLIPVALATFWVGIDGWALVAVGLAPIIGHAYTPFLRFRGGKALAVSFGVWTGLTTWPGPVILGLSFFVWLRVLVAEAWAVMFGMLTMLVIFLAIRAPWEWYAVAVGNLAILAIKQRDDFRHAPRLAEGWLAPLFRR